MSVCFSPDGKLLASGGEDKTMRLWEVATGKEIRRFSGHRGPITGVAFSPGGRRVATGGNDTTCLIWNATGLELGDEMLDLADEELRRLWDDLAGDVAGKGHRAVWRLAAGPTSAVPFLRKHLAPAAAPDPKRLARLIADLDSDQFAVRESATAALAQFGGAAAPPLRAKLADSPSPEIRRRIEQLLGRKEPLAPESLRALRAVEVLEHIGSPEAKQLLDTLASGAEGARLTIEAQASLHRLQKRVTAHE